MPSHRNYSRSRSSHRDNYYARSGSGYSSHNRRHSGGVSGSSHRTHHRNSYSSEHSRPRREYHGHRHQRYRARSRHYYEHSHSQKHSYQRSMSPESDRDDSHGHFMGEKGDILNKHYLITRELGTGTFARAFEVKDTDTDKYYAVKVVRAIHRYCKSAKIEAKIAKDITERDPDHRFHCYHLKDEFEFNGHYCMVMDLLGESLYDVLKENDYHPFPMTYIRSILRDLFEALAFLHGFGLTHTDLKLENLLFSSMHHLQGPSRRLPSLPDVPNRFDTPVKLPGSPEVTCTRSFSLLASDRLRQCDLFHGKTHGNHQHAPVPSSGGALRPSLGRGVGHLGRGVHRDGALHRRSALPDARRPAPLRTDREDRGAVPGEDAPGDVVQKTEVFRRAGPVSAGRAPPFGAEACPRTVNAAGADRREVSAVFGLDDILLGDQPAETDHRFGSAPASFLRRERLSCAFSCLFHKSGLFFVFWFGSLSSDVVDAFLYDLR
ncbi:uncharacterized protein [Blastocystis hominis]|uniref:Protein kinase domain-containing protein n=1 Tax=Blastocystis hominis TaxID=12968 RepID=D8M6P0_BLAHO|nr:uncharacterized protein [Blastocystis hominis]CBK23458.2 unnamed protein product [Blastocystis hominis]|eukprot:XP_012897506.1 uncharacterized protein [Blastocystis hominis]